MKKLERWTRQELEAEARRLGARGARALSRSELLSVIVRRLKSAGAWRERAARWAGRMPAMRWASRAWGDRERASRARVEPKPVPADPGPEPTEAETPQPAEVGTPSPVSHEPAPNEPIRTRSMARLLAAQGHLERALEVYEALLREQPHDISLRHEAAALRADPEAATPVAGASSLPRPTEVEPFRGDERVSGVRLEGARAHVRWRVTEAGRRRAQQVLGGDGELALRVVLLSADPTMVVRSSTREHAAEADEGERTLEDVPREARVFVAVGLRHQGRFAAIAHVAL